MLSDCPAIDLNTIIDLEARAWGTRPGLLHAKLKWTFALLQALHVQPAAGGDGASHDATSPEAALWHVQIISCYGEREKHGTSVSHVAGSVHLP